MNNGAQPETRPAKELQRAHDMLVLLVLDETPLRLSDESKSALGQVISVLCWALGHEHIVSFRELLEGLERDLAEAGVTLTELPELTKRPAAGRPH